MPHDTLFITDLHGNLDALRNAVGRAERAVPLRHLVVGGDVAPNLVTVRFLDGEFVLRHEQAYVPAVGEDFRRRIREHRPYRARDQHGKRSLQCRIDMRSVDFLELDDDEMRGWLEGPSGFGFLRARQAAFLEDELIPLLRHYRVEGKEVFVMLGNDDFAELECVLVEEERLGRLAYLHGRVHALGRSTIMGYSCVLSKPFRYRHWERSEEAIERDLALVTAGEDLPRMVLSIHMPPYGTKLDMPANGGTHVGSRAVRKLLEKYSFGIGLFGHIHESHLVSGARQDLLGDTPLINPGGYHDDECCAVVFDSCNPRDWRGLWETGF